MRSVSLGFAAAVEADVVAPAILVEGLFDSGAVRLWSGIGELTWNGHTWTGAGNLLAIGTIAEKGSVEAIGTTVTLSGIPSELVSLALAEPYQGRLVKIYLALFTTGAAADYVYLTETDGDYMTTRTGDRLYVTTVNGGAAGTIIADPDERFTGRADVMALSDDGQTATITLSVESRLIDLQRPRSRRYTHDDQQIYYPADLGLQYVADLQDKEFTWGSGG